MRYQATLENMTVPLFVYWLQRDHDNVFEGLDRGAPTCNNQYEYTAAHIGYVGKEAGVLFVWAYQISTQTVKVGWDQSFGGPPWAESLDLWINFRLGANAEEVTQDGRELPRLNGEQLAKLKIVRNWRLAKESGIPQETYCQHNNISVSTLKRLRNEFKEMGFEIPWPERNRPKNGR